MKKRILSFMLVLLMIFSVSISDMTVLAETPDDPVQEASVPEDGEDMESSLPDGQPAAKLSAVEPEKPSFNAAQAFTLSTLQDIEGYSMEMDEGISLDHFEIEEDNKEDYPDCSLSFPSGFSSVPGGAIAQNVPGIITNQNGQSHAYLYAYVGNTRIYYVGKLTIYNDDDTNNEEKPEEYIFYTTDTQITNRTVYVVLKETEKIALVYEHGDYHSITYEFQDADGNPVSEEPDTGWTYDAIFGKKARAVADGASFNTSITIPRGYQADILIKSADTTETYKTLGEMMSYQKVNGDTNHMTTTPASPASMILSTPIAIDSVNKDLTIIVRYRQIDTITFSAYLWSTVVFASGRFNVETAPGVIQNPDTANTVLKTDSHSFTWEINTNNEIWEMDQFEINGESVNIPMTAINDSNPKAEITALSTGTVITLTVQSLGTSNPNGYRHYTFQIDNCYEDLTVSGGNLVGSNHREFAVHSIIGLTDAQYFQSNDSWKSLRQSTLMPKTTTTLVNDPIRFKTALGYANIHVSFTKKDGSILQQDGDIKFGPSFSIDYLIRNDIENTDTPSLSGEYESVSFADWKADQEGYYYLRGTDALYNFMYSNPANNVILLNFYADPIMSGLDYRNGGDSAEKDAPKPENISNTPTYQNGGEQGYNIRTNPTALVSNTIPTDASGKFVFDHWAILTVENGSPVNVPKTDNGAVIEIDPGTTIPISTQTLTGLSDCLYFNEDMKRQTLTLQAVWRTRAGTEPIPYKVRYFITCKNSASEDILIEEHEHTVNEGATLISDLYQYQNGKKTLSAVIQSILAGDNDQHKNYAQEGTWVIDEARTDKKIISVDKDHNVASIYLVKTPELVVTNTVGGTGGDKTKDFSFTLHIYKAPESGGQNLTGSLSCTKTSADQKQVPMTLVFDESGNAAFELKHGEKISIPGLPFDYSYSVAETKYDEYRTTVNEADSNTCSGTLDSSDTQTIHYLNVLDTPVPTGLSTRGNGNVYLLLLGVAGLLSVLYGFRRSRKRIKL